MKTFYKLYLIYEYFINICRLERSLNFKKLALKNNVKYLVNNSFK